jgi:fatty-acyl-CoA synthase
MKFDRVSLDEVATTGIATPTKRDPSRLMVSCGTPAIDLRVVGENSEGLPERHVGEVQVRGESVTVGYVADPQPDEHFEDGWLRTGDMGYLADGDLYIAGRAKDMVIVMGQNYYPEDFEWVANRVNGVRPGRCVAIASHDTEDVVLLVEAAEGADAPAVVQAVKQAVRAAIGVTPGDVAVLPRGMVRKTTSGKLRRTAMRDLYVSGTLERLMG